jgi:hypothetical protein
MWQNSRLPVKVSKNACDLSSCFANIQMTGSDRDRVRTAMTRRYDTISLLKLSDKYAMLRVFFSDNVFAEKGGSEDAEKNL